MYCPKCGKKLPDGARFCDQCGASLTGDNSDKSKVHNGWIICLVLSVLALFRAYHLYASSFFPYDYQPPYSAHEIEVFFFCGLGLVGLITGIFGLYHENTSFQVFGRTYPPQKAHYSGKNESGSDFLPLWEAPLKASKNIVVILMS